MTAPQPNGGASLDLGQRSAVAFSWGVATSLAKVVLTIMVQAVLARLLGPTEFGLFALGILLMGMAGYFADVGLATSLVQQREVRDSDIRFVLTFNLVTATTVAAVFVLLARPLAQAFGKPEATDIFRWLAPVFLLNATASVSTSLLRRRLDYRSIQLANLAGYTLGFGLIGVASAMLFESVMSLVAACLSQAAITLARLYRKTQHPIGLSLRSNDRRAVLSFGATVLVTNLVNWTVGSLDRLLVGRMFSAATLGNYSAAYNLIFAPVGALYPNLQSTVFSSMARIQGDMPRLRNIYLGLLQAVSVVFLPPFVGLYFFADQLVLTVYGSKWTQAAALAGPFCLMAPFLLVWACSTPVLWNTGQRSLEWKLQVPFIALAIIGIVLAASSSALAVAWIATLLYMARTILMMFLAFRTLGIAAAQAIAAIWPCLWISTTVGLAAMACAQTLLGSGWPPATQFLLGAGVIGGSMLLAMLLAPESLPLNARCLIGRQRGKFPSWLQPVLNRF